MIREKALKLLDQLERQRDLALRAFNRYHQYTGGTHTSQMARAAYEKWSAKADATAAALRAEIAS